MKFKPRLKLIEPIVPALACLIWAELICEYEFIWAEL